MVQGAGERAVTWRRRVQPLGICGREIQQAGRWRGWAKVGWVANVGSTTRFLMGAKPFGGRGGEGCGRETEGGEATEGGSGAERHSGLTR